MTTISANNDSDLVNWFLTKPKSVSTVFDFDKGADDAGGGKDKIAQPPLPLSLVAPVHLQFLANVVFNFGPFRIPTEEEEERFGNLQRLHHTATSDTCTTSPRTSSAPDVNDTPFIPMRLSPRMVLDPMQAQSKRRDALKRAVQSFLNTIVTDAEKELMREVDEDTKRAEQKKNRSRRKRKAKKKKIKDEKMAAVRTEVDEGSKHSDSTSCDADDSLLATAATSDTSGNDDESCGDNDGNEDFDSGVNVALAEDDSGEATLRGVTRKGENLKSKKSYLAIAAKGPKQVQSKAALPPPPNRAGTASTTSRPLSKKRENALSEEEEIVRLKKQLSTQRQQHLELVQQLQLRAFISETKSQNALDRNRELERQILDATYPEVEATRMEAAAAEAKGGLELSPRDDTAASIKSTEKGELEHELKRERRENLAMMQRIELRILLAETKAKAAEERSQQLEELLGEAQDAQKRCGSVVYRSGDS